VKVMGRDRRELEAMAEGVEGMTRDKTREPAKWRFRPPHCRTLSASPWHRRPGGSNPLDRPDARGEAADVSLRSVQRNLDAHQGRHP
jgi:hypothetical protein